MPFAPVPKKPGDLIRSQDWNEAMAEVVRLESAKVSIAGGNVTGTLSVKNLVLGTPGPPMDFRPLTVRGASSTYVNIIANNGTHEILIGADGSGGIVSTMTNHDLQLRAGTNVPRLTVKASGRVGIGTTEPAGMLDIVGTVWNQHLRLTNTTGGAGPCIYFNSMNRDWAILGTQSGAGAGDQKLGFFDATSSEYRMVIDKDGRVGIGTTSPGFALEVVDRIRLRQGTGSSAGLWLHQSTPNNDRAFVGMADDNTVGFWGNTGVGWGLRMNTTSGNVTITGSLTAGGGKGGYVVDNFINAVGETLEQGDVVVLGGNEVDRYYGVGNSIPVPEVDLTDRAYDTRVCGIVDSVVQADSLPPYEMPTEAEIAAARSEKNARRRSAAEKALAARSVHPLEAFAAPVAESLDASQVQAGQLGKMVTLGAYAWCKVDADVAPIAVGDLLTTSPTRGHAQKVTEPGRAVGTILGKALGARKKGKGKIPVLVLLQ